jgi:hypothetical protein
LASVFWLTNEDGLDISYFTAKRAFTDYFGAKVAIIKYWW